MDYAEGHLDGIDPKADKIITRYIDFTAYQNAVAGDWAAGFRHC